MATDDTTTLLDEASAAAIRLMVDNLSDHDVVQAYEMTTGSGAVADLLAKAMQARNLDD